MFKKDLIWKRLPSVYVRIKKKMYSFTTQGIHCVLTWCLQRLCWASDGTVTWGLIYAYDFVRRIVYRRRILLLQIFSFGNSFPRTWKIDRYRQHMGVGGSDISKTGFKKIEYWNILWYTVRNFLLLSFVHTLLPFSYRMPFQFETFYTGEGEGGRLYRDAIAKGRE